MRRGPAGSGAERAFLIGIEHRSRRAESGRQPPSPDADNAAGQPTQPPSQQTPEWRLPGGQVPPAARQARQALQARENAGEYLVPFTPEESINELGELASGAGAVVIGRFLQKRDRPDPATLIGRGKLEELAAAAKMSAADLIIFDHELTPSQQRNLERGFDCRVIDRTQLILDIFARHARTREGQLQVELAQLQYLLPRLAGRGVEMSQLGGGIGTRGPGETQLETDRRRIYRRIRHVKGQLEEVRRTRAQQRQRRLSVPVATVAMVGYTNAGKSTLFNALTNADVPASSRMFATLDPTLRSLALPSRRQALLSDTVGFIRNLPHTLISAFRATLEEVQRAALILHVADASSPTVSEQMQQVEAVLRELESAHKPRLLVLNKIDLLPAQQRQALVDGERTIHISAARGINLGALREAIDRNLQDDPIRRVRLRLPQTQGKILAMLEGGSRIVGRQYVDGAAELEVDAPESLIRKVAGFLIPE
ncbi:MAG: GTPase HflX [Candidatus Korobacteraceae bacterium]